jgi:putative ABC transport system ATP-binding protein
VLAVEEVVKHYAGAGEEVRAVDGVTFSVERGEMLALLGPSGSGKTTLLLLVAALLKPEAGTIRVDGRDLTLFSENEASDYLMRDVGFVFQRFHLMKRSTAVENAARKLVVSGVGLRDAKRQAATWLERVGLSDRLEHTAGQLSGGERQRVALARALACEPRLILADEPTGSLDSARSQEVVALLKSVARETDAAVLLVTHDQDAALLADRRLSLRDGKLIDVEQDAAGPLAAGQASG